MNTVSMTGTGLLIFVIEVILHALELTPEPGTAAHVANGLVVVASFVALVYGQVRRKDLHWGLFRKS